MKLRQAFEPLNAKTNEEEAEIKAGIIKDKAGVFSLKGISTFEIINFCMIVFTFINLGLKYLYDKVVGEAV